MNTVPARRRSHSLFPDFSELFATFPSFAGLHPIDTRLMRLEDEMKEGRYELRAEIPGTDPAKDVKITVHDGQLTITAERSEKSEFSGRSEFSYGSFVRSVSLPAGANEDDIKASYDKGILTVSVGISEAKPAVKHIQVESSN